MNDLSAVQIRQAIQHPLGDLPEDLFPCSAAELLDFFVDAI